MKNLFLSKEFAPSIVSALQEPVRGRSDRSVAHLAEYFLGGAPAIGAHS